MSERASLIQQKYLNHTTSAPGENRVHLHSSETLKMEPKHEFKLEVNGMNSGFIRSTDGFGLNQKNAR